MTPVAGKLVGDAAGALDRRAHRSRFTRMAEKRLPYDVVYLLNRYFEAVGSAIERAGGIATSFTGDGVMALSA